ncbi:glycine betaine/proline transport system substrate-binding protein [Pseudomonas citronellolis]|uniref:Glycine betaine/proline transport system substrate-binding protein n=1 Tax=Pseudomonas citronellolis TaxID=53408 RepID=A0AAQ1HWQ0_9PSED|nr:MULTISPECIES: glycine betaine ABC transporter substrate-binding protein [Pseudomonas]MCL6688447.1 glycine betaine ABC transporter substrate-binding protein [Pseudomonas sp. R3.Fl]MDN6873117.1 glycine betaine ABC transporter substrate-binding protein [Pseudomonas citronellolis]TGC22438.1 glycine/betaine ABC transporter substrate-binding protein [Pseudomonas citronellolis]UUC48754.1 glycine betaine ABC transporter substrate-binding protein [Pseudomonas citronellolis]SFD17441.1 glycine betaine
MRMMRRLMGLGAGLVLSAAAGLAGAAAKPEITIGYVDGWSDSVATTHVAAEVIREKLGYPVKLMPVAAGIMWQGVARGKLDAMLSAWLPVTHGAYYEKMKSQVVDLGVNYPGAKIGLIVPEYVKANSIEDLKAMKDDFGSRIVGIDAGAGVMLKTDQAIKDYGLDYKLVASSGSGMIAELTRAENDKKAVAVTGWIPHWMFAKWKLKFLDDPKKVYGEEEHVDSVANPALEKKAPEVWALLKKLQWKDGAEIGQVMLAIQDGAKPEEAAKQWVASNPDRVKEWTQ